MKKAILPLLLSVFICHFIVAQSPLTIPYQAVARDASGNLLANQNIALRFSIHDLTSGGTVVYQERQTTTTNKLGLFNVSVGGGTIISGTFGSINWATGSKFIQVELDPAGGASYTNMGTSQMQSVPYALYAGSSAPSGAASGDLTGTYPAPTLAAAGTTGTYTKVTTDTKGRVISGTTLSASDIPALAGDVSGAVNANTVGKIQGTPVTITSLANGNLLQYNSGTGAYVNVTPASVLSSSTTNTLGSSGNTLTSTVNGAAATAPVVNSVSNTSSTNTLSTTVNGVAGTGVNIVNNHAATWTQAGGLTDNVNGVSSNVTPAPGTVANVVGYNSTGAPVYQTVTGVLGNTTVGNTNTAPNSLTTTVNGVTGSSVAIVNSVSNSSSTNTLTTTVNGVTGTGVNIINTNALSENGSDQLVSTVNGVASTALTVAETGDVTGNLGATVVSKINGSALGTTTGASTNALLQYNGTNWAPSSTTSGTVGFWKRDNTNGYLMPATLADNVGVGTITPGQKLTVVDAGNANNYSGTFSVFANNLTQGVGIGFMGIQAVGSNTNQDLSLSAKGTGNITMQVTGTTGFVGIGTTTPGQMLEVNGNISLPSSGGNKQIYTWSPTDGNWRIGMSTTPGFTRALATSHVEYATYASGAGQGFAVGDNVTGLSSFEVTGSGSSYQSYFRGNVYTSGALTLGAGLSVGKIEIQYGPGTGADNQYHTVQLTNNTTYRMGMTAFSAYCTGSYLDGNIQIQGMDLGQVILSGTTGWYGNAAGVTASGSCTNCFATGADNQTHWAWCPDNYIASGIEIYASGQLDGCMKLRCSQLSTSYATIETGTGVQSVYNFPDANADNFTHVGTCPAGTFIKGVSIYASSYLDTNLRVYCTGIKHL